MSDTAAEKRRAQARSQTKRRQERRKEKYLGGKPCVRCGSTENLQCHHIDPNTKIASINFANMTERAIETELAKCEILCYVCHREHHAPKHGTLNRYRRYNCRCAKCVEGARERWRTKSRRLHGYKPHHDYDPSKYKYAGLEPTKHGTLNAYTNYKCRCTECKMAATTYSRKYREKKSA